MLITHSSQPLSRCSDILVFLDYEACPRLMWNLKSLERPDQITVRHRYRGLAKAAPDLNLA